MKETHPLISAAKVGDVARVVELLAADPGSVEVRDWTRFTPLMGAVADADSAAVVRLLLAAGADPNVTRPPNWDMALHWVTSAEVAALLLDAGGVAGLDAPAADEDTPLHVAARYGRVEVMRVFLAAGADPGALNKYGETPLDVAREPRVALLLISSGAPLRTGRPSTPLHDACRRAATDSAWAPVITVLLDRGADSGVRDEFGALPSDLLGSDKHGLVRRELLAPEAAANPHGQVAISPDGTEALTAMYSGTVLVRWRLAATLTPIEVTCVGGRTRVWGPYGGSLAFSDMESVWLRDWSDPSHAREVPRDLRPELPYPVAVLSPNGRHLLVTECEGMRLVDLPGGETVAEVDDLGDYHVEPRFSPDGRTIAVGNSSGDGCWLTVLDGDLRKRYQRDNDLPHCLGPETLTDLVFTPDGRRFATWLRPASGYYRTIYQPGLRGAVAVTWTDTGASAWNRFIDTETVGTEGVATSAPLCFTPDGTRLAVGLDTGILWLNTETGAPAGLDESVGTAHGLAAHPAVGVLATTNEGLRRVHSA